jgi:hypothetical protein
VAQDLARASAGDLAERAQQTLSTEAMTCYRAQRRYLRS